MGDINGKINITFYHRDFDNMKKYANLAKSTYVYEKIIEEIISYIDYENSPGNGISNSIHNNDLKQKFLNKYSENTQHYMKYIIFSDAARMMEEKSGRDLCVFAKEELLQLIVQSNPYSLQSAITQLSVFRKYIDFTITEGYLTTNINPANFIKTEDIKKVLNKEAMQLKYLTKEELIDAAF